MKRSDLFFALTMLAIFMPFVVSNDLYAWYTDFNHDHAMVMAFLKFGILATLGEMLGCRIATGNYTTPSFGVVPRMVVWGVLGMAISMAMTVFASGIPVFITSMGGTEPCRRVRYGGHRLRQVCRGAIYIGDDEYLLRARLYDIPQDYRCPYR